MTKREMFMEIKAVVKDNADMVAFIDHEIELLARKADTPRKPTKTQVENAATQAKIVDFLATVDKPLTIREIQEGLPETAGFSTSKMSHLLNSAVYDAEKNPEGVIEKVYIKKVPYFSIRCEGEDAE